MPISLKTALDSTPSHQLTAAEAKKLADAARHNAAAQDIELATRQMPVVLARIRDAAEAGRNECVLSTNELSGRITVALGTALHKLGYGSMFAGWPLSRISHRLPKSAASATDKWQAFLPDEGAEQIKISW